MIKRISILFLLFLVSPVQAQVAQQISIEQMRRDLIKINESIEESTSRIKEVRDARFLPDLYFALAEFHIQKAQYMYALKIAENKGTPIGELDFTNEKRPKLKAIEIFDTLMEKFPKLKDKDKAMFFKGHEQRELGRLEDMIRTYAELSHQFPNSQYWPESVLAIGDFQFENKKDIKGALLTYQRILKKEIGPFTPVAHYKIGWALINLRKFSKALLSFEKVLTDFNDLDLSQLPDKFKKSDVRTDALLASVWPYSEMKRKDLMKLGGPWRLKPIVYYKLMSPDLISYRKVLKKLGHRMTLKKRFITATQAYFELLRITQDIESRIDIIEQLYVSMKNSLRSWPIIGFSSEIEKTVYLVRNNQILSKAQVKKYINDFEIYCRDIATRQNKRAKKTGNQEDWSMAVIDYNSYLRAFPNSKYNLTMHLNLAESYFNSKQYLPAAKEYEHLASVIKNSKKKKSLLESSVESYTRAIKKIDQLNRLEITEARNGLRASGQDFIRLYPKEKITPSILFNIAQTYYDERNFNSAIIAFQKYIKFFPNFSKTSLAINLTLDSFNQQEDFKSIISFGKKILRDRRIKDRRIKQQVAQIVQQAEMKNIQAASGDLSSTDYAKNLLKLAHKYKGSNLGDQALYEAFLTFKAQKDPRAYQSGEQLVLQHGKSKYAQVVVNQMGQMAMLTADFRRAALYFELYNERYKNEKDAKKYLENAAKMREMMGDFKIASRNYRKLGDNTSAARMDFLARDWASLLRSAPRASSSYANYWEGLAQYRLRGIGPARTALTRAASLAHSPEAKEMAAHSLYLLAMDTLANYKKIQLKAGNEAKAVKDKTALLQVLEKDLSRVIQFGDGRWTIAGLYGLGQSYREFAIFISKAPLPRGLNAEMKKQYRAAIKKQANTYKNKSIGYFKQCILSSQKYEIFTSFVLGCQSMGRRKVSEEQEMKTFLQAKDKAPSSASEIRKKLYDDSRNINLLVQLAAAYIKGRDYSMAEAILHRVLEIEPERAKTMAQLGVIKLYKNELQDASEWFKKSTKTEPGNPLGTLGLAGLYKRFKFKKAYSAIKKQIKSKPKNSPFLHPILKGAM